MTELVGDNKPPRLRDFISPVLIKPLSGAKTAGVSTICDMR